VYHARLVRQNVSIALLGVLAFAVYAVHRLRFVGDCDSWAYFAQAELFLGRDPGLHSFVGSLRHAALTPLGMDVARGGFVSAFPPGYSLLLAASGLVGGQYWVNPLLGAASVVLIYFATLHDVRHPVALAMATLWGTCPLVAMNATDVMSDMAATVALLGSYVALRSGRCRTAGLVFGLSLMVRPMNLLFFAPALLLLPRRFRSLLEFSATFTLGALVSAGTEFHVWGALLSPTYRDDARHFMVGYFPRQFPGYARQTALHLGPVLGLGLLQGVKAPRKSAPELVWLAAFILIYPFAGPVDIDWTRQRFILPAYPAAFVLAARGAMDVLWVLQGRSRRAATFGALGAALAALVWGAFGVGRSLRLGALQVHPDHDANSDLVTTHLPQNALVGAVEYSGALRLYGGLETFVWLHPGALSFARAEYLGGRPVYLLIEPEVFLPSRDLPFAERFSVAFDLAPELALPSGGYVLQKIVGARAPGVHRLTLVDPVVGWALLGGWLRPEEQWGSDYRAARCDLATVKLLLDPGVEHELEVTAAVPEGSAPRNMDAEIRGRRLGSLLLGSEFRAATFRIPGELVENVTTLDLRLRGAPPCSSSERKAVAGVRTIETRAAGK
jgi:hypothetical protein